MLHHQIDAMIAARHSASAATLSFPFLVGIIVSRLAIIFPVASFHDEFMLVCRMICFARAIARFFRYFRAPAAARV